MKAILIDPHRREVKGIEIEGVLASVTDALRVSNEEILPVQSVIDSVRVLYYNVLSKAEAVCWYRDRTYHGKIILLGRKGSRWPVAVVDTVREVECLTRFL